MPQTKQNTIPRKFEEIRVLIIDDQPEALEIMRFVLKDMGIIHIYEAIDGHAALQILDSGVTPVDVVICDWNIPKFSGVQLLKKIRDKQTGMPFLMVSGRSDAESILEAKNSGVTFYIRKPYSPAQLEAKLRVVLDP